MSDPESRPRRKLSAVAAARLAEVYKQEYALQSAIFPTVEDVPSCLDLMYVRMECILRFRRRLGSYYINGHAQGYCEEFDIPYQLCMKKWAKLSGEPEKRRDAYIRYRAEWATERRMGPSSEDVWKVRKVPLEDFPPRLDQASMDAFRAYMSGESKPAL
ncbi:hypothetical protein BDY24DRAFT_382325 [Mrakia frigida]|uniref:uncharacterized protein n=1 Tax=Mrakia frigida TaxID=29902 RepID=UPI003FCC1E85